MTAFSNDPLYPPRFGVFLKFEWPLASSEPKHDVPTESDRVPDLPSVTAPDEPLEPSAEPPSAEPLEPSAETPSAEPPEPSAEPPEPSAEPPEPSPLEPSAEEPSAEEPSAEEPSPLEPRSPSPREPSAAPLSPEKWSTETPAPRANLKILELTFGELLRRKDAW